MLATISVFALLWAGSLAIAMPSETCGQRGPYITLCEYKEYAVHAMQRTRPLYPDSASTLTFNSFEEAMALDDSHGPSALVISRKTWALVADNTVYAYASSGFNQTLHDRLEGDDTSDVNEEARRKEKRAIFGWPRVPTCNGGPCEEEMDCRVFNCAFCFPEAGGIGRCAGDLPFQYLDGRKLQANAATYEPFLMCPGDD